MIVAAIIFNNYIKIALSKSSNATQNLSELRFKICFNASLNKCVWGCMGAIEFLDAIDNDKQQFHFQEKYVNVTINIEITQINVKNKFNR